MPDEREVPVDNMATEFRLMQHLEEAQALLDSARHPNAKWVEDRLRWRDRLDEARSEAGPQWPVHGERIWLGEIPGVSCELFTVTRDDHWGTRRDAARKEVRELAADAKLWREKAKSLPKPKPALDLNAAASVAVMAALLGAAVAAFVCAQLWRPF